MVPEESSKKITKVIEAYASKGWWFNFGMMHGSFGDASRTYMTNGTDTVTFKVFMDFSNPRHPTWRFQIISFKNIGMSDDLALDKNGNLEYDMVLEDD